MIKNIFTEPKVRNIDLDHPHMMEMSRQIIRQKSFLLQIYLEWYYRITKTLEKIDLPVLELGSGGGFLKSIIPELITSDISYHQNTSIVLDGQELPFRPRSLGGIVMTNTLHHLPKPRQFFTCSARSIGPGGVLAMIEPWVTPWSRLIYSRLHHEPFQPNASEWEFASTGPVSGANGALPWILFQRDCDRFLREFPQWEIEKIELLMPFRYLLSGGLSYRSLVPGWSFNLWRELENIMDKWLNSFGMFAFIVLRRTEVEI
jgi:hypothetical protein